MPRNLLIVKILIVHFFLSITSAITAQKKYGEEHVEESYTLTTLEQTIDHFGFYFPYKETLKYKEDWITITPIEGREDYYNISVTENESDLPRKAEIFYKANWGTITIHIIQEGQDITSKFECKELRRQLKEMKLIPDDKLIRFRDVKDIENLDLRNIRSSAGLEYFVSLKSINLTHHSLYSNKDSLELNFWNNKKLKYIECYGKAIKSINVNECTDLEELHCVRTHLDTINVSKNYKLRKLIAKNNIDWGVSRKGRRRKEIEKGLCAIVLPKLGKEESQLEELNCEYGLLTRLELYKCPNLKKVNCGRNRITDLELQECSQLTDLRCSNNKIEYLDLKDCVNLDTLICQNSSIKKIRFAKNNKLRYIDCSINEIYELDTEKLKDLEILDCSLNLLASLDLSANTSLQELYCRGSWNKYSLLKDIIFPDNRRTEKGLTKIVIQNQPLETINLSKNPYLEQLNCSYNKLKEIDLMNNLNLEKLDCRGNYIRKLDLKNNKKLTQIECGTQDYSWIVKAGKVRENQLTHLFLPDQKDNETGTRLKRLDISDSRLKTPIDLKALPELEYLDYSDNGLKMLDVSHNPNLIALACYSNKLKTLDVSKNPNLKFLNIGWNNIKEIDLRNNKALKTVYCVVFLPPKGMNLTVYVPVDYRNTIEFLDNQRLENGWMYLTRSPDEDYFVTPEYIILKKK
ncbi:MAG: hypothetical protein E6767_16200 [Dysgonomonas sp.]|nr:hypothetical protein [Dysgonomonas sp.]